MQVSVNIDLNRNNQFDHWLSDLTHRVRDSVFWVNGFTNPGEVESNAVAHISPVNQMRLILDNADGALSLEKLGTDYYNLIYTGLQVKITLTHGSTSHSFTYYTDDIEVAPGEFGQQVVYLNCTCAMPRLQKSSYEPLVETDVRTDVAISNVLSEPVITLPYTSSYFFIDGSTIDGDDLIFDASTAVTSMSNLETGQTTIEYVGDVIRRTDNDLPNQKSHVYIADVCIAEGFGRFFYQARDGKFHFHNRHHDRLQSISLALDSRDIYQATSTVTTVYNKVRLHFTPRVVGESVVTLFSSESVPITLPTGKQKRVRVRFNDPDNPDVAIAALNPIEPLKGGDLLYDIGITHTSDIRGTGGTIFFDNPTAADKDITQVQVRGTPITIYESEIAEVEDGPSMYQYNRNDLPDIRAAYITDTDFADRLVNFLLNRHKSARHVLSRVTVVVRDETFDDVMGVTIGDVISVEDTWSGHDETYVVMGEYHQIDIGRGMHRLTWYLRSIEMSPIFIIDSSVIDGIDLIGI